MNPKLAPTRLSRAFVLALSISISPLILAQDDAWFEEQAKRESNADSTATESSSVSATTLRASPEKVYRALRKELDKTPEYALTKRIELLRRAAKSGASKSADASQELAALDSTLAKIQHAIALASSAPTLESALATLKPYSRYFQADFELSKRLVDSPLNARIDQTLANENLDEISAIRNAVAAAGLSQTFGEKLDRSLQNSQSNLIYEKWANTTRAHPALPGEQFLIRRALGQDKARLPVSVSIENHHDPRLQNSLQQSLIRQLGNTLAPSFNQPAEFSITLTVDAFGLDEKIGESTVDSLIPGAIQESINPDFVEVLARYEKQAKRYDKLYKQYEIDHQNWIDTYNGSDRSSGELAIDSLTDHSFDEAIAAIAENDPWGISTDFAAVRGEMIAQKHLAQNSGNANRNAPQPPAPFHLETLEQVYQTPSTILDEEPPQEYSYTKQNIVTTFQSHATLSIETPLSSTPVSEPLELKRDRAWTRNVGVDPRDPKREQDDYSEEAIEATKDLFYLELASNCASHLEKLFQSASDAYLKQALKSSNPQSLVTALSLKAATADSRLPEAERARLNRLAADPTIAPQELRQALLASIVENTGAVPPEEKSKALAIIQL